MIYKPLLERKLWGLVDMRNNLHNRIVCIKHPDYVLRSLQDDLNRLDDEIEMVNDEMEELT